MFAVAVHKPAYIFLHEIARFIFEIKKHDRIANDIIVKPTSVVQPRPEHSNIVEAAKNLKKVYVYFCRIQQMVDFTGVRFGEKVMKIEYGIN